MAGRLTDKVALVVGAASGIGAAVARRFASEGAVVAACDLQSNQDSRNDFALVRCDITDDAQVRATVGAVHAEHGRIDVLVNAAGIVRNDNAASIEDVIWNQTLDVNLTGIMHTMRAVLPGMLSRAHGSIVNIASVAAFNAGPEVASYAAAKAGVIALTRSAAQRYGHLGVRVNAVCPGWVDTPMSAKEMKDMARDAGISIEQAIERTVERIALRRMANPEEIAAVCLFLASEEASFVTGSSLVADGGMRVPAAARSV